jgi:asparagine synthase (glutamine-hydrolysing)
VNPIYWTSNMCGIFALINRHNYDLDTVKKYFMYGSKRGPEFSKYDVIDNVVTLGFHRLAINGMDSESNQPLTQNGVHLICNGEIYNHKDLIQRFNIKTKTNSDCEVILHLYALMGEKFITHLDGVFSFIIYDSNNGKVIIGRDPLGVRPLYISYFFNSVFGFCSDLKPLMFDKNVNGVRSISQFAPGTFMVLCNYQHRFIVEKQERYFDINTLSCLNFPYVYGKEFYMKRVYDKLLLSVKKRVDNTERPIACLLSGGLDSSVICALVNRFYKQKTGKCVQTYSIGLEGSVDLKYAKQTADFLRTQHTEIIMKSDDFLNSIPHVIEDVETYDTTTVRASVGNWNVGKYISEHSNAKVIFNGDGADELMGGYLYFQMCPNNDEFDRECRRLLHDISYFDVLRSDKSISSHGLEPRTPYLDKDFVTEYLNVPVEYRNLNEESEKRFFRTIIHTFDPDLIPRNVLYRRKEAFSDGVSSTQKAWYEIIKDKIHNYISEDYDDNTYNHNIPKTMEQKYYRYEFESLFGPCSKIIPYFWMPKYVNAEDSSARSLAIYQLD